MKSNKLVAVLISMTVILALVFAGIVGLIAYRSTHIFIEGNAYYKLAENLDLREKDISLEHYSLLQQQLPNCKILWKVPFQGNKISSDASEIKISNLSEEDITVLCSYFPELKKVDASDCGNYAMLEQLQITIPQLHVDYSVTLGPGKAYAPDTTELTLTEADYDYKVLQANLSYLKNLTALHFQNTGLQRDQIDALKQAYPQVEISCTIEVLDREYDMETDHMDLSDLSPEQVETAIEKMGVLTNLQTVELNGPDGVSSISRENAKKLILAFPDVSFHYTFEFYGTAIDSDQEEVIIKNQKIGDAGEKDIRDALDLLSSCSRFVLDNCKVSNEVMAKIRDDYRDRTKVVWRVWFGEGTSLTDAEILRSTYNVEDDNSHDLIYLEDVRYMDIGHNEWLDYCDFISGMKNLEVCIISGAPIKSLEPFAACENLRVLEMANCIYVPDLEPLRNLKNLKMLNIGFTRMKSMEPIMDLDLTHLTLVHSKIPEAERTAYEEAHEDCWIVAKGDIPYGKGWRYDNNNDPLPWYAEIKEIFRYPTPPNNVGWYLD